MGVRQQLVHTRRDFRCAISATRGTNRVHRTCWQRVFYSLGPRASAVHSKEVSKDSCSQPRRCSQTEAVPHDSDTLFAPRCCSHKHGNVEGATYANREMLRTTTRTPRLSMATPAPRSTDIPSSLPWSSAANAVSLSSTAAVVPGSADEVTGCVGGAHPPQLRVHLTCSSRCWPIVKPCCTTDASSHPI